MKKLLNKNENYITLYFLINNKKVCLKKFDTLIFFKYTRFD